MSLNLTQIEIRKPSESKLRTFSHPRSKAIDVREPDCFRNNWKVNCVIAQGLNNLTTSDATPFKINNFVLLYKLWRKVKM